MTVEQNGPDPLDVAVGLRLRTLRKERGRTQEALAGHLRITFQQVRMTLTPAHMRGARGLLAWSQRQLAERSGVSVETITRLEGLSRMKANLVTLATIERALAEAGVVLIHAAGGGGSGVRLAAPR